MAKVDTAEQAVEIARKFLETSGQSFNTITGATLEKDVWVVEATTIMGRFMLKIDRSSGAVTEYTRTG